jgi:hypothetical protein
MANLYANVLQVDRPERLRDCFGMLTDRSARLLNLTDYGFAVGRPADIVILNAQTPEQAIAEIAQPLAVFKHGRQTVVWHPPQLLRPRQLRLLLQSQLQSAKGRTALQALRLKHFLNGWTDQPPSKTPLMHKRTHRRPI